MSTDWGYGCETCGVSDGGRVRESCIIDNARSPRDLGELLAHLDKSLSDVLENTAVREMLFGYEWVRPLSALCFAIDHRKRGHVVRVCDEYGRFYEQCSKYVDCSACKHSRLCSLKEGHEGPCSGSARDGGRS